MLLRNLTLSGIRSDHTVRVSTIYQFVTVFNHSDHAVTVFPENLTLDNDKHYRVPPRIYLTLPLIGAGMVESCQREVVYTVISEGVNITPTVIGLSFTEENNNINMTFPDTSITPTLPIQVTLPPTSPTHEIPFVQPNMVSPLPLPVNINNFPLPTILNFTAKHDLIRGLIPRSGTIPIAGSITFVTHTSHVRRYSILIRSERACTLILRERIDTIEGNGVFIQVANVAVPGGNAPFAHTGELLGNMLEVVLWNGTVGTSMYDISMLGHVT